MPASPDRHLEKARRSLSNCASNCLALADENTIARTPECDAKHCSRQSERLPASYTPTGHATIAARKIIVNELPILSGLPDDRQKRCERAPYLGQHIAAEVHRHPDNLRHPPFTWAFVRKGQHTRDPLAVPG
ncbi:hypothetical protein GCM10009577_66870 [Streptomyces javensis]